MDLDELTPTGGDAQPEGQGTVAAEPAPAQAPAQGGSGPWMKDLEERFNDPQVRTELDSYLREVWQPRVTQLEQRQAEAADALSWYQGLNESPAKTYLELSREILDDDAFEAVYNVLAGEPDVTYAEPDDSFVAEPGTERDPEVEALLQEHRETKRKQAYDAELERIKAENPDVPYLDTHIHPFVASSGGDFDVAVAGYKEFLKGLPGGELPNVTEADVPDAPAVIGSDSLSPSTPPIQQSYQSLDAALDDFFNETRASAPPTVGGV